MSPHKTPANTREAASQQLRAPRTAAHFPIVLCTSKRGAKRCAYHAGRRLPTPQMISNKLLTAFALLAQHGAALDGVSGTTSRRLDDLCAPASTSAARRARRTASICVPTQGSAAASAVGRRDRGADGRADRAGLVRTASKLNDSFKNPIWSKLEPPALRIGCAPAYQWTGQRHGAWPWALRRAACPRAAPESPAPHGST